MKRLGVSARAEDMAFKGSFDDAPSRRVVITGLGVLTPIGTGREAFARALRRGDSGIRPITAFDPSPYRCRVGGEVLDFDAATLLGRRDMRRTDRASLLALAAAQEAIDGARLNGVGQDRDRWGVILGTTLGGMVSGERFHRLLALKGNRKPSLLLDFPLHAPMDHICSAFGIQGPSFTVASACASGAQAIGCALNLIRGGEADIVLSGGVDTLAQLTQSGFDSLRLLVPDGELVRPFDRNRTGLALGEGAGVLVLEERERALRRQAPLYAEISGFGISNDSFHMTAPEPEGRGAARAIVLALADAGLRPGDIDYINAHGTGTIHNDVAESRAIQQVFGDRPYCPPVSSTKSMMGHTLGAAGGVELVATVLAMQGSFLPPTINYETADPACVLDYVPNEARPATVRAAISNSIGFGGVNCCLVVVDPMHTSRGSGNE